MIANHTKDVMVTFSPAVLKRINTYCERTGLKRSTAIMQAIDRYLLAYGAAGTPLPDDHDLSPHPHVPPVTHNTLKKKLGRRK